MAVSNNPPPRRDPDLDMDDGGVPPRRISPVLIGLVLTVLVLLALIFIVGRHDSGSSADDRLSDNALAAAPAGSPEALCARQATYDLIKKALFRQAAQVRGSDQAAYDRLVDSAFVRMEAPVLTGQDKARGAVSCSGSLTLELPPGLAVAGGRRVLGGEIDYIVQPAADGSGTAVLLSHAEGIVTPLSTLTRTAGPAPQVTVPDVAPTDSLSAPEDDTLTDGQQQSQQAQIPEQPTAHPSFNCDNAHTRGEIAVCTNPGLASLDRQMASQFNSAMSRADPEERDVLQGTRDRFLLYRDRCRSEQCVADAYRGRVREIRDIMAGTWRQPR